MEANPIVGTIKMVRRRSGTKKIIWHACIGCGKERWLYWHALERAKTGGKCVKCAAMKNGHGHVWKGGRVETKNGYIDIWLREDDFFFPMARYNQGGGGYVSEHRLVVAKALGRCLHLWEIVHHKNGIKDDNRYPENLQLVTDDRHKQISILENRIKLLEGRVTLLEAENTLLKSSLEVALA